MKYQTGQSVFFAKNRWRIVEVFDGKGTPSPSTITLQLISKAWYLMFSNLPYEVVVGEKRFLEIYPDIRREAQDFS